MAGHSGDHNNGYAHWSDSRVEDESELTSLRDAAREASEVLPLILEHVGGVLPVPVLTAVHAAAEKLRKGLK